MIYGLANDLPPPAVFVDINQGKTPLADGLVPNAKMFLDVAEAWRWQNNLVKQEIWMAAAKVQRHLMLSTGLTTIGVPLSWCYFDDRSTWDWARKFGRDLSGDKRLRGKKLNALVFYKHSHGIMEFYKKKTEIAEVELYSISRKDKKLHPGFKMKRALITECTDKPQYQSWNFEIVYDDVR